MEYPLYRLKIKFLTKFFDLLYQQFAWLYDIVSWTVSFGQWNSWILSTLPFLQKGKILEIGFGTGHLQREATNLGLNITGIDLSHQMGKITYERMTNKNLIPKLVIADGRQIPLNNESVNQVVATFPAEYILEKQTLQEIHRILTPSGELIIVPMAWITGKNIIHQFLAWLFKITGQTVDPSSPLLIRGKENITEIGFNVSWQTIESINSKVMLVTAKKQ